MLDDVPNSNLGRQADFSHNFSYVQPGGDRLQNTKIPLAVNNVIPLLIGPSKNAIMYHLGEGTRPCPFAVIANGQGQVTASGRQSLDLA